jgi:catalase
MSQMDHDTLSTHDMTFESLSTNEDRAVQRLISLLGKKMLQESPGAGKMQRDAHPKLVALVKAEFVIEKNLPEHLRVGVFAKEEAYLAWVRFSNQNAPPANDNVKDIRGMAIKLVNPDARTSGSWHQDFVTISSDVFVTKNVEQFADLITSLVAGKLRLIFYFLSHPKNLWNFLRSNRNYGSLLEARFWSVSPYSFGNRIVKYSIKPMRDSKTPIANKSVQNYLTTKMAEQLAKDDYYFDFMIQFQTDPIKMPLEDLSVRWKEEDSPFIKVATLRIPKQTFDSAEQNSFGDQLSFTPWHCLLEHRPLGGVNTARKVIYDALSTLRHKDNNTPRFEPTSLNIQDSTSMKNI